MNSDGRPYTRVAAIASCEQSSTVPLYTEIRHGWDKCTIYFCWYQRGLSVNELGNMMRWPIWLVFVKPSATASVTPMFVEMRDQLD